MKIWIYLSLKINIIHVKVFNVSILIYILGGCWILQGREQINRILVKEIGHDLTHVGVHSGGGSFTQSQSPSKIFILKQHEFKWISCILVKRSKKV